MSILAKNMKMIRRELKCTQSALAEILKVGFRTYVRYEAGERDAPISILVKMSRLGNISLEQRSGCRPTRTARWTAIGRGRASFP